MHLSGSEVRIFPGVVSRTQRRASLRVGSVSADHDVAGLRGSSLSKSVAASVADGVIEDEDENNDEMEGSDREMEEAAGVGE